MKLETRLMRSIAQSKSPVVLRADLAKFGSSSSQLSEVLKALISKGVLVRMGVGVYAKTKTSSVTGAVVPAGSLETLVTEALRKLGAKVQPGSAAQAYNSGQTTQVPGAYVANTGKRRISRKLAVGGRRVVYENNFSKPARSTGGHVGRRITGELAGTNR